MDGGWQDDGGGVDRYGFSAMAGGFRVYSPDDHGFGYIGYDGSWWTATEDFESYAYDQSMVHSGDTVREISDDKRAGSYVRCIRDDGKPLNSAERKIAEAEKQKEEEKRKAEAEQRIEKLSVYFTDSRDGRKYRAVTIGGKMWMAQNLNYKTGKSWCYDNDTSYCDKYGRLYDWHTARKACPSGWHLPTSQEWDHLGQAVGGSFERNDKTHNINWFGADMMLKSISGWDDFHGESGNGDDVYGFSALPGGYRYFDGNFGNVGNLGLWWTATEFYLGSPYVRRMMEITGKMDEYDHDKRDGFSVRCVRNNK